MSKGIALTLFLVITIIAGITMLCFTSNDYFYMSLLLFVIIMAINFAWMYIWAKKHDKQKHDKQMRHNQPGNTLNQPKNTLDIMTEEAKVLFKRWQKTIIANIANKTEAKEITNAVESSYGYIIAKAARVLISAREKYDYKQDDFFCYPLSAWNLNAIYAGCNQLIEGRGLTKRDALVQSHINIRELFELFHFSFLDVEKTDTGNVYKMNFIHKIKGIKSFAYYCPISDLSILNKPFFSTVCITDALNRRGIKTEEPVFVVLCEINSIEKKPIIEVYSNSDVFGVAAEYSYIYQQYPDCKRKSQHLTKIEIDGKLKDADVLVLEFPDGSEKEVVFDISNFFGKGFEGFSDKVREFKEKNKMNDKN